VLTGRQVVDVARLPEPVAQEESVLQEVCLDGGDRSQHCAHPPLAPKPDPSAARDTGTMTGALDVTQLRADARERAAARTPIPFDGEIADDSVARIGVRRYQPTGAAPGAFIYLHGGYGVFGDLDLQDNYCRLLAAGLAVEVVSVDYRLAPEASLSESVADALTVLDLLHARGVPRLWLAGDSAGGTVACLAAEATDTPLNGLLLTNPVLDLSLSSFDDDAPEGPDRELSEFALLSWCRVDDLAHAPELGYRTGGLPPCLVVVGDRDALVPEARAFVAACEKTSVRSRLVVLPGAGHGFVSAGRAPDAVAAAAGWFDLVRPVGSRGTARGMKGHIAEASIIVAAPPERVWAALTEPEYVRQYLMGTALLTDWKSGSRITWSGEWEGKPYTDKGEVIEVEEGKRLVYSHYSPLSGAEDSPENYHTLWWSLEEVSGGTQVVLNQDNNSSAEEANRNRETWEQVMASLKKVAEGTI
jgi:acetyl esterase